MSANNTTMCPNCQAQQEAELQRLIGLCKASYGKISEDEFAELCKQRDEANKLPRPSLSEYYDVGIRAGKFEVSYGAHCDVCKFSYEHRHIEEVCVP